MESGEKYVILEPNLKYKDVDEIFRQHRSKDRLERKSVSSCGFPQGSGLGRRGESCDA